MSPALRAALLVLAVLSACGGANRPAAHSEVAAYAVTVRSNTTSVGHFDLAALHALPAVDVATPRSRGKLVQRGPTVRVVLAHAGVRAFSHLRAAGSDSAQTFTSVEIDDQVVLDFDNNSTVKLAGAHLPQDRWVRNVTELDALS